MAELEQEALVAWDEYQRAVDPAVRKVLREKYIEICRRLALVA